MPDHIYLVDPLTKNTEPFTPISFAALGIKERSDLQEWVLRHPQLLGEDLHILTSEFNRFDKSNKRLDILALDRAGKLVIIELKLDTHDSLAELQAIRYAAFCSTMTMDDAIEERARFYKVSRKEAEESIGAFLEVDELPELDNKPRIIVAAGSMDDQELTSTALWLRTFDLDISCVELTPYKLTAPERFVLVPRVIIPTPEAKEFLVGVQRKEAAQKQAKANVLASDTAPLWQAVAAAFNPSAPVGFTVTGQARGWYMKVRNPTNFLPGLATSSIHYEWLHRGPGKIAVALHFETKTPPLNQQLCQAILQQGAAIGAEIAFPFAQGVWKGRWRDVEFLVTSSPNEPLEETARRAADLMKIFIERSRPLLETAYAALNPTLTAE